MDWIAGAVVGLLVLTLREWLADLYAVSGNLLLVIGAANLAYSGVSFTLAMSSRGGRVPFLRAVAAANMAWAVCCLALAVVWSREASLFGLGQLVGEAVFVGGLGVLEWRAGGPQSSPTPGSDPSRPLAGGLQAEPGAVPDPARGWWPWSAF